MEAVGIENGWNRKVRNSRAMIRASTMTTMVSRSSLFFFAGASAFSMEWLISVLGPGNGLRECHAGVNRQGLDNDEGLGHAAVVGDGDVDMWHVPRRHKAGQHARRAIGERHGRLARGQVDDAHIAP